MSAEQLTALEASIDHALAYRKLETYTPYRKQLEFHAAGATHRERDFMAGNQLGKTLAGGAEFGMHMTGIYPDWWPGKRYRYPTNWWAGGVTSEGAKTGPQTVLLGPKGSLGTGMIPIDTIIGEPTAKRSIADAVDGFMVRHISGGISHCNFKSYDQGREKWQAATLKGGVWFDEEPPEDIYSEGVTRINATDGIVFITSTPLLGMSAVVRKFYPAPDTPDRHITNMTINDVDHYSEEKKKQVIASYPAHERKARALGVPFMGSGQVFPIDEEEITFDKGDGFTWPETFTRIVGLDFGWDHPTAAAWIYHDRDNDILYVDGTYRQSKEGIIAHAAAIKARGDWIPVAWPHDGLQHDKGSGETLAAQYRAQGVNMLHERATFEDGGHGFEAGIAMMLERMETGRLKVARGCFEFFDEFRQYHRKDGLIVKEHDDVISAIRYAMMMIRYAKTRPMAQVRRVRKGSGWAN